ncbi:glycerophosphodiester phosphodiesterase [Siphonobacter curvatus]|uniref:Glycerophosphodiester phosphodiesterase n=1 Tax=Siphonobacter curvatus TaxID=2094562 RepID=A0A2S7IHN6_9BACT|nr:glycerophosphodiester phosphodiesterase family protein [Siphonobacter curvatus]PQA55504.1 glycerophosphodiester phosphodiesterase [Siphonobacter curvatus]
MNKRIVLAGILSVLSLSGMAQDLLLTQYTYKEGNPTVGKISALNTSLSKIKLSGPQAKYFGVNEKQELYFKKKPDSRTSYEVKIEAQKPSGKLSQSFQIIKDEFHPNGVIAHRGAWKHTEAAQNSIASLQGAIKLGCYGSEFDVHMSADSVLFINHDPQIQGVEIEKANATQLSTIQLKNGEKLPTLEQYLSEGMKQKGTKLILEIKTSILGKERSLALTEKVVKMVRDLKAQAWVEYIAFDYDVCKKVVALDPYAKVAYLMGNQTPEQLAADKLTGLDYHFKIMQSKENYFDEAKQKHLTVNVWTVNDPELMKWLMDKKADFITTDEPEQLLSLKKQQ